MFFTGQNLNLHGILGVTIGAVMTCGEIVGHENLVNKIIQSNNIEVEIGCIKTPDFKKMKDADTYQIGARAQFTVF